MRMELVASDAIRTADAYLRIQLWQAQKNELIFKSSYDPDERITHYTNRLERYGGYLANHVKNGTPVGDILNYIETIFNFIPKEVRSKLIEFVSDLIKKLLLELVTGDNK